MPMSRESMRAAIADPATGSIRRRWLQRRVAKVIVLGPDAPPTLPAPRTPAEIAAARQVASDVAAEFEKTVRAEIAAVEQHAASVAERSGALRSPTGSPRSYSLQELTSEYRHLVQLLDMLRDDLAAGPPTVDRDGRPITDHARAYCRVRAREMRDSLWAEAERHAASGDHREARVARRDALRARMIAEDEMGWRPTVPGYGMAAWT